MNGIEYIYNIGTRATALLAFFALVGCVSDDYDCPIAQTDGKVAVDLVLNVTTASAGQGSTRMSPSAVKANALSVQDFHIVPFSIPATQDSVLSTDVPSNNIITTFDKVGNYFLTDPLDLKLGTNAFLCYAKAQPQGATANPTVDGALSITALPNGTSPAATRFNLKAIQEAPTILDAKAVKILDYMNSIAMAANWYKTTDKEFQLFINNGGGLAGSSRNIIAYVNEWYSKAGSIATIGHDIQAAIHSTKYVTLSNGEVSAINGVDSYPAGLPDGTAVMTWNNTKEKFEYDEVHWVNEAYSLVADNNKFADYVYPAERYFYANSRIYTSGQSRKEDYSNKATWNDVLNIYENKGTDNKGVLVDVTTRSVAIKNPLSYGVAGMEIHIKANVGTDTENHYLRDDDSKHENYDDSKVTLSASTSTTPGTFPLTAIMIGSQVEQNYCFEPADPTNNDEKEYAIYDTEVKGIKPSETSPTTVTLGDTDKDHYSAPVYTIGLQTKDELSLKVVLEFLNNSEKDFISENGVIYKGTKFYLVASVVPPGGIGAEKRVMTRGHMSTINLTINSLKSAYNALPDLSSDKLRLFDTVEAGIRKWQVGQTGEHEVYNW